MSLNGINNGQIMVKNLGGFKVPSFLTIIYSIKAHFYDKEYENYRIKGPFRVKFFYKVHYLIYLILAQKIT